MATNTDTLTTEDLEFLARPLHGFLTVAGSPQPAQPRPVWFEATADGTVQLFTPSDSVKLRRAAHRLGISRFVLRRNAR